MGLTGPQGMLMGSLARFGKMKISDLSEKLDLSNSTVSGIVDRLEKQNLLVRTRSEDDRRVVYVEMTPEYKRLSENKFKELEIMIAGKIDKASVEEMDKILEGLSVLKKVME
jgi:MarR family transcriptional regulator, organic hydroperoxide resistance regulator